MKNQVKPRTLAGTVELLPNDQIIFNQMIDKIRKAYESFGFLPVDTPIIELSEILLAKAGGETEKQIYRFNKGDNDLSLRFDLTVPLAKYVSMYQNDLAFPFKRYQIGKVYRGERPQKCRFREFYQCDVDVISDKLDMMSDAEMVNVIYETFQSLDLAKFTICINNRKILNGLFEYLEISDKKVEVLRLIDKIDKIGENAMKQELEKIGINQKKIDKICDFIRMTGNTEEKIAKLKQMKIENKEFSEGLAELEKVTKYVKSFGIPDDNFRIDLKIARGLDYYTGTVYETFFDEYRNLGSVCSGGRYDNLTEYYTDRKFQGVGISIGLTRLFAQLKEMNLIKESNQAIAKVLVVPMTEKETDFALKVAQILRQNQINTDIYSNFYKDMKAKLKYADKLNIPYVCIIGEDEIKEEVVMLKNMKEKKQEKVRVEEMMKIISK